MKCVDHKSMQKSHYLKVAAKTITKEPAASMPASDKSDTGVTPSTVQKTAKHS